MTNKSHLATIVCILVTNICHGQSHKLMDLAGKMLVDAVAVNASFKEFRVSKGNFTAFENDSQIPEEELPPPTLFPVWVVWLWTFLLGFLLLAGVGGNALVVAVVSRTRDLRSSTNLLLVNLAGADILVLLVPLPTALTELHSKPETWILGEALCEYSMFHS